MATGPAWALPGRADVLIQNLKPGALARPGFDPVALRRAHPDLITCSISGYGIGPLADRKAYDLLIQAEVGLCSITGGVWTCDIGHALRMADRLRAGTVWVARTASRRSSSIAKPNRSGSPPSPAPQARSR